MGSAGNDININKVDKVAVLGAGPGGLAAAKYLLAERTFSEIIIFEQRLTVGGVWKATPHETKDQSFTIPQTRPSLSLKEPIKHHDTRGKEGEFELVSPIYDALETNIPHTLMNYSDLPFPRGTPLFPSHQAVLDYLERYAGEVRHLIKFGVQVSDVRPIKKDRRTKWSVTTRVIRTGTETTSTFDAVIVANGHYDDPFVPDILGIKEWNASYPGIISHSKFYRRPDIYKNKKVLIIGNSASGTDIAAQISHHCTVPLLISSRSPTPPDFPKSDASSTVELPEIAEFLVPQKAIRFINGHVESNIDALIFCTGYMYSFPFLSSLTPPVVVPNGSRTQYLYQQLFYYPQPTLSFLALPQRIIPFPISESQSAAIARFLSGRLNLPSEQAMREWEEEYIRRKGTGKGYHVLGFPWDAEHINYLHEWAMSAEKRQGLENDGVGKIPPYWGEKEKWLRERIPVIKSNYRALGEGRLKLLKVEDLGMRYEKETS